MLVNFLKLLHHSGPGHRQQAVQCAATEKSDKAKKDNSSVRQLLGMKGASVETNIWKIRLQLTKPVTWVPLIWGAFSGHRAQGVGVA